VSLIVGMPQWIPAPPDSPSAFWLVMPEALLRVAPRLPIESMLGATR
jgi:hypothetical protein